ncbi:MAG: right-handed parallel beta-helix repeat-containing protein [Paracoccaceae bacterium]
MAILKVANQQELLAALKTAQAGDTVLLADGHYGDIDLKNKYTSSVTIKAENPLGAEFTRLGLVGATNITLDGLQFQTGLGIKDFSKGIAVLNSDVDGMIYCRNVDGLMIDNTEVSGGNFGVLFNSVQNFSITNSYIHHAVQDVMRITGNSYNGLVENNVIAETTGGYPLHPDLIQLFAANGVTPHDLTIRGNLLYDHNNPGETMAQGIFMSDPAKDGYRNILIEDNLLRVVSPNSIYINGGQENVIVQHNTLMPAGTGGAIIRLAQKSGLDNSGTIVTGNVVKSILDETKASQISDNYVYSKSADMSTLFSSLDHTQWTSYIPVEGSAIDFGSGYGAQGRLLQLLEDFEALKDLEAARAADQIQSPPPLAAPELVHVAPDVAPEAVDQPDAAPSVVYAHDKTVQLSGGKGRFVSVQHDAAMETDEGTISLTFNADVVGWKRGLISKDTAGAGDAISAWIDNGKLVVRFQDGEQTLTMVKDGITAHKNYDLVISFDNEEVQVWLDSELVGKAAFDVDLSQNTDDLVIGAFNGKSRAGTFDGVHYFFDGTITDVMFHDTALSPAELAALDNVTHTQDLDGLINPNNLMQFNLVA